LWLRKKHVGIVQKRIVGAVNVNKTKKIVDVGSVKRMIVASETRKALTLAPVLLDPLIGVEVPVVVLMVAVSVAVILVVVAALAIGESW
jgi:hypothetical protein